MIYKRIFGDVLAEEQESRDYGPLLGKMGVIDSKGNSAMDADQWEAASAYFVPCSSFPLTLGADLYMAFAFKKE